MREEHPLSRTELLLGQEGLARLKAAHVAVFGLGGVGGYAVEALARSGIGALDLIDSDTVSVSNLNRQILATVHTVGRLKTEAAEERILSINPAARVRTFPIFLGPDTADRFDFTRYDYVIDAIDTVTGKLLLVERARAAGTPIISSMGTGNKLDPSALEVTDLSRTSVCPLARVMRKELKKRGISHLKVVYSREDPLTPMEGDRPAAPPEGSSRRQIPGSTAFVPAAAGLLLASEVVRSIAFGETDRREREER